MRSLIISQRVKSIIASPIRKFLPLVQKAEKRGIKFIKLNIGDPDILPSQKFNQELRKIKLTDTYYAASTGVDKYITAWLKYFNELKIKLNKNNIISTAGASEAITFALQAVCDVGDEVLVFEPIYTNYKALAKVNNIKLKPITLKMENNYKLPESKIIEKKITKKTKAIIIINPDNPTGKIWSEKELNQIIKIAKKYKLFIIADETYRGMSFGYNNKSLLKNKDIKFNLIVVDSLSKRLSLPGLRQGVLISYNQNIINAVLKLAMARLSVSTIDQLITVNLIKQSKQYIYKITQEYEARVKTLNMALKKISNIKTYQAQGAFYQVLKLPIKNSEDFIKFLITKFHYKKTSVLLAPMSDFYITPNLGKDEVRIALVVNNKKIKQAIDILKRALIEYKINK